MTIETVSGDMASVNVDQITHVVATGMGTLIHFTSGEHLHVSGGVGDVTLQLAAYSENMRAAG